ncbi:MAG: GrpB family protein [Chloroflexota bacterium]|nr:GrpB family protein [Chloroflexota bacterium]
MALVFRLAASIAGLRHAFAVESARIAAAVPSAEVRHTGASSIDTLLTLGDLDIQVRVTKDHFLPAAGALEQIYAPYRREMWTGGFAAYRFDGARLPVGVVLTAVGSVHDERFVSAWRRLAAEPDLVDEYNALKLLCAGGELSAYEAEKAAFFTRLVDGKRRSTRLGCR